jgi:hypothetical protein
MNATLEQIYARHDPKVLLEKVYVKAGAPIGNTNAAKGHWSVSHAMTGETFSHPMKFAQFKQAGNKDSDWEEYAAEQNSISRARAQEAMKRQWDSGEKIGGNGIANHLRSKGIAIPESISRGLDHDDTKVSKLSVEGRGMKRAEASKIHKFVSESMTASLATRIETLLARDSRPTYYAPDQPELHNAVRDRAQAIYQRAVDRSVDYAAAKAAKLVADRKIEAKKRAAAEEEIILLFLMLMEDASEEAYQTSEDELSGVLGEDPEVVQPAVLKEFVEQRRAVLSGFPIEMSQRLTRIVTDGIERGQTDREIRSKIAKEASAIKKGQGSVVSLTEAQCTYGASQCRLLQRAGFETCFWVTQGDEKVRQSHRECEEAGEVTIGHEFPNGLRFPGDPQGPAYEVCNCRCNLIGGRRKSGIQATAHDVSDENRDNAGKWTAGGNSQTETSEFKAWFGDSKVVNADGKPLVVYHGSRNANFNSFNNGKRGNWFGDGIYLTSDTEQASKYAAHGDFQKADGLSADTAEASGVLPVYVSLKKPLTLDSEPITKKDVSALEQSLAKNASPAMARQFKTWVKNEGSPTTFQTWNFLESHEFNGATLTGNWAKDIAMSAGFDGIIAKGGHDSAFDEIGHGADHIVAFHPTQIKSAIGNSGKFDPKDPRITSSSVIWRKQP